jgi:hypothetical protein
MSTIQRRTIFVLCIALCASPLVPPPGQTGILSRLSDYFFRDASSSYDQQIQDVSSRFGVDYYLIKAVIAAESGFDHIAISPRGAMGLMQLMPGTAREMGVVHPFAPRENIEGGARYLRYLLKRFNNDTTLALAAYNAGPEVVKRYGGIPPFAETRLYLKRVLETYTYYRDKCGGTGAVIDPASHDERSGFRSGRPKTGFGDCRLKNSQREYPAMCSLRAKKALCELIGAFEFEIHPFIWNDSRRVFA